MQFHRRCIGILVLLPLVNITNATVVPRRAVLGFSSNVQRKRSSTSSSSETSTRFTSPSSSTSSAVSAATINAREIFDGTFFSSETLAGEEDEDSEEQHGQVFDRSYDAQEQDNTKNRRESINHRWWGVIDRTANINSSKNTNNIASQIREQFISTTTTSNQHPPAILLLATAIGALVTTRRGLWLRSIKSTLRLLSSLASWYLTRLEISPLLTKCITGGIIAWIGDYGAQWFEYKLLMNRLVTNRLHSEEGLSSSLVVGGSRGGVGNVVLDRSAVAEVSDKEVAVTSLLLRAGASDNAYQHYHNQQQHHSQPQQQHQSFSTTGTTAQSISIHGSSSGSSINTSKHKNIYDYRRGIARFLECLLISSPLMHYGYELFEYILPVASGGGVGRSVAALSHVVADSVFLDGIFVCTGIIATGLLEGHSLRRHVLPNLRNVYLPTMKASVCTSSALIPLQFLSFRFLPVQLRVLSVNAVDLIWTGVVSFVSHSSGGVGSGEMD